MLNNKIRDITAIKPFKD